MQVILGLAFENIQIREEGVLELSAGQESSGEEVEMAIKGKYSKAPGAAPSHFPGAAPTKKSANPTKSKAKGKAKKSKPPSASPIAIP